MKKSFFLIIICSILFGAQKVGAQIAKVALSHNGNITMFNADELQTAIDASVDGDTLFLNEGDFRSNITISKKISLIGTGQNTKIWGNVKILSTGKLYSRMFDAIYFATGTIYCESNNNDLLDGLILRKCKLCSIFIGNSLTNAIIDRCWLSSGNLVINSKNANSKVITIKNSIINSYNGSNADVNNVTFINCNILKFGTDGQNYATFYNSIVNNQQYSYDSYCQYIYCYLKDISGITQNCQSGTINWTDDYHCTSSNMLGQDGTPVGIEGGTTPYTLVPTTPKMESFDLKVDTQSKKLNVNIKMTAN